MTIVMIRQIVGKPEHNKQYTNCRIHLISASYLFNWLIIPTFQSLSNVFVLLINSVSYTYNTIVSIARFDISYFIPRRLDLLYTLLIIIMY